MSVTPTTIASHSIRPDALRTFVDTARTLSGVPGVCVAVSSSSGEPQQAALGSIAVDEPQSIPPDTRFQIGCLSKTLVSAVALELDHGEDLDLNARLCEYLPELAGSHPGERVLVRHLMCHSAGYAGIASLDADLAALSWQEFIERIRAARPLFEPGTVFSYELSGAALLGEIVRRVSHRPSGELVHEMLLEPLFGPPDSDPASNAIGHLRHSGTRRYVRMRSSMRLSEFWHASISERALSVNGLTRLARVLMTGAFGGRTLLSPRTVSALRQRSVEVPALLGSALSYCLPIGQAPGLAEYPLGIFGQDGTCNGQVISLRFSSETDWAAAVAVNAIAGPVRHLIMAGIAAELGVAAPPQPTSLSLEHPVEALAGRYVGCEGYEASVTLEVRRVEIDVRAPGAPVQRLTATLDDDGCLAPDPARRSTGFTFFRDPASAVPCLMCGVIAFKRC